MKNIIPHSVLCLLLSLYLGVYLVGIEPQAIAYEAEFVPVPIVWDIQYDWTEERIKQEVHEVALKYNVSESVMNKVIKCESMGSTTIQSYYSTNGKRESSYGLAQINLIHHPNVTKAQAFDPAFAIDFLGKNIAKGHANWWSCWKILYK